uniref:R3H domain-containing protein n=1 Tax=Stomoxys calcitrans TaxID=35570 RepID=A0A1I8P657_STOCA
MGMEKNLIDPKLNKPNSLGLYRPPALRNNDLETSKHISNASETQEVQSLAAASDSLCFAATGSTTTSISCNNSPIHRKENVDDVVVDMTTSTQQSNLELKQQSQQQQQLLIKEVDGIQKQTQRQQQQARRERRPDRAVYIPRARRSQTTPPTTTQIQQSTPSPPPPPPPSAQVITPTANGGTTAPVTTAASHTSKSLNQQLAITADNTTAASVNEKPSSKVDEVGKTVSNSTGGSGNALIKKREKISKEARERREHRSSKKSLSAAQSNQISKNNNTKLNENLNKTQSDDEFSSQAVIVIAKQVTSPPVLEFSPTEVNILKSVDNANPTTKVFDCDSEDLQIKSESVEDNQESRVPKNYLICNRDIKVEGINEFAKAHLLSEPTDTVISHFTNVSNSLTNITNNIATMPKPSNKIKNGSKASTAADNGKMPTNLRIEDVASQPSKCDIEEEELQRASKEINRSNRRIMKQTFVSDVLQIPDNIAEDDSEAKAMTSVSPTTDQTTQHTIDSNSEEEEDDWEKLYDDSGECIDPKIMQELAASVGKCKIELPKMDYSAFLTKQSILNDEEFPHVLEVSNFPVEFKNQDLLMVFSQYKESGFDIKWVDDTHALAVFSSSRIAAEVLTMGHPFVVLKPLAEATLESRVKAKKCAASLQPYRPRPETCAALARRLVTGALGVKLKTAAAERENEKRVLREAKERKLLAAKQRDEVWDS